MFFVKLAFWLAIVVAMIPVRPGDLPEGVQSVTPGETVSLARAVANDVMTFCERNEDTCVTGSLLMSQMGAKAREGARIAYSWLDERYGADKGTTKAKPRSDALDSIATGSLD